MTGGRAGGRGDGPEPAPGVSGIVLAGGRSSRFGRDKLAEPIDGEPLLWRPIRALADAGCAEIVVVLAPDAPEPALPLDVAVPVRFARDPEPFGGPLVGLHAGLVAASGGLALVVAGDQPDLRPALLRLLAERAAPGLAAPEQAAPGQAAAAALVDPAGVMRPIPCALDRAPAEVTAGELLRTGERRIRALLAALRAEPIPEAVWRPTDPDAAWTRDVDEPRDLADPTR